MSIPGQMTPRGEKYRVEGGVINRLGCPVLSCHMVTSRELSWLEAEFPGLLQQVRGQTMEVVADCLADWAQDHNVEAKAEGAKLTIDEIEVSLGDSPETALAEVATFLGYEMPLSPGAQC